MKMLPLFVTTLTLFASLAPCAWSKEIPGDSNRTIECSLECWRYGYEINLIAVRGDPNGPAFSFLIQVDKTWKKEYANDEATRQLLGKSFYDPAVLHNRVQRVARHVTVVESYNNDWCDWRRVPVSPEVNLVELPNDGRFTDGEVHFKRVPCNLDDLVEAYDLNVVNPLQSVPFCGKEGCPERKEAENSDKEEPPRCFVPAEFASADEIPEGYFDGTPWEHCDKEPEDTSGLGKLKLKGVSPRSISKANGRQRVATKEPGDTSGLGRLKLKGVSPISISKAEGRQRVATKLPKLVRAPKKARCKGHWTAWLDRDDPGGSGDFETLRDHHQAGKSCAAPTNVECRTKDGRPWTETGESYSCTTKKGGICLQRNQAHGKRCSDYEVRFCC